MREAFAHAPGSQQTAPLDKATTMPASETSVATEQARVSVAVAPARTEQTLLAESGNATEGVSAAEKQAVDKDGYQGEWTEEWHQGPTRAPLPKMMVKKSGAESWYRFGSLFMS